MDVTPDALDGCFPVSSAGNLDEAEAVIGEMRAAGCEPNARTYSALLWAQGRAGRYDLCARTAEHMAKVCALFHLVCANIVASF